MIFNIIKTIHIFSVISWMAGILYLPRIFVYHADKKIKKETSETFKIMERKLYQYIMVPSFLITWISGIFMVHYLGLNKWLIIKFFFVILLTAYHFFCQKLLSNFALDKNVFSSRFFRFINEIPAVIILIIIFLVVFKPF
jgi:putative membrane protein